VRVCVCACAWCVADTAFPNDLHCAVQYARGVHPKISRDAQPVLVDCYRKLRQMDQVGQSKTAYRITVRQLEAMIRLSEALARLHLDGEVKPRYVREAFRLLKKSIVHVNCDTVDLESARSRFESSAEERVRNGESPVRAVSPAGMSLDDANHCNNAAASSGEPNSGRAPARREQIEITYEEYSHISNLIAMHLRRHESALRVAVGENPQRSRDKQEQSRNIAMSQSSIINWYLGQRQDLVSEDQLVRERNVVANVIQRLINRDGVLVVVGHGVTAKDVEGGPTATGALEKNRLIMVHPNFVLGSI